MNKLLRLLDKRFGDFRIRMAERADINSQFVPAGSRQAAQENGIASQIIQCPDIAVELDKPDAKRRKRAGESGDQ